MGLVCYEKQFPFIGDIERVQPKYVTGSFYGVIDRQLGNDLAGLVQSAVEGDLEVSFLWTKHLLHYNTTNSKG